MEIQTYKLGENYVIKLNGELDASTAASVEKTLDDLVKLAPEQIQVDCKELKYISSRGLGVFISRLQEISDKHINFSLYNMSEPVKYIFKVLGLDELIEIRSDKSYTSE